MADRIVIMRKGVVQQIGSPDALFNHPANLFVAGFIGSPAMNFIPGVLRLNERGASVHAPDGAILPMAGSVDGSDGQKVVYGVRPEHLMFSERDGVPCRVRLVEPTGANTYVYAQMAGTEICAVFAERHAFSPGDVIHLQPQTAVVHLFDAGSGRAIDIEAQDTASPVRLVPHLRA